MARTVRTVASFGGALLGAAALAAACSAFSGDDSPDSPPADATSEPSPDAPTSDAAPSTCIPQPLDLDAGPEDASCEPGLPPVNLSSSSKHCGRCGHDCQGDGCAGGRCVVTEVSTSELGNPQLSVSADGVLFYTAFTQVRSLSPASGAPPTTLASVDAGSGYLGGVAVAGAELFFKQSEVGILRLPITGGVLTTLVARAGNVVGGPVADATNVYYTDYSRLIAVPRGGGAPFDVQPTNPGNVDAFATDGARIYWALRGADVDGGVAPTTLEMRGVGKTDSTLDRATGLPPTRELVEDVDYIYIVSGSGEVRRVAKQGVSAPELIGRIDGPRHFPKGVAVDADSLFIAGTENSSEVPVTLYRLSKCGGPMRVIADDYMFGGGLASAGPFLYWGRERAIARIAK